MQEKLLRQKDESTQSFIEENETSNKGFIEQNTHERFVNIAKKLGFDVQANRSIWNENGSSRINIPNELAIIGRSGTYYSSEMISKKGRISQWMLNQKILNHFKSRLVAPDAIQNCRILKISETNSDFYEFKKGNVAIYQHPVSKILCIDIDTHTPKLTCLTDYSEIVKNCIQRIVDYSGAYPVYSEISKINRGAHLYYKISEISHLSKTFEILKRVIQSVYKEYNVDVGIECRSVRSKRIRLPLGIDYVAYLPEKNAMSENLKAVFDSIESNIENSEYEMNYNELITNMRITNESLIPQSILDEYSELSSIWDRACSNRSRNFNINDIKITAGNRAGGDKQHFRLAFQCINLGLTYDDFRDHSFKCNVDSKDLTEVASASLHSQDEVCKPIWDSACEYHQENLNKQKSINQNLTNFYCNISLLTEVDHEQIEGAISRMGRMRIKKREKLTLFAREFVGKHNYECHNPRRISSRAKMKKKTKESLVRGVQFPLVYVKRLKEHYQLKGDIKSYRSTIYTKTGLFKNIAGYFNNSNGSSCKQFKLTVIVRT